MFKWQSISFISRLLALVIGVVQGSLIVRILSISEWGSIQVILAASAIIGSSQALGLTSGTTREIVGAKDNAEAYKVFITSLLIRLAISVPFLLFFYFFAENITRNIPNSINSTWAVRVIVLAMLFDTATGIFNSVISGFKQFKVLFSYQIIRAFISFIFFVLLTYRFAFEGYFYAFFIFNFTSFLILFWLALRNFKRPFPKITFFEFKKHAIEIFGISLAIYLVKVIYSFWDNSGSIFLNRFLSVSVEEVAILSLALVYAKKLMVFSDSITDVTLPVMSKKYFDNKEEFKTAYTKNFSITFVLISFFAVIAVLWSKEVILLYTGKKEFLLSSSLVPFVMLGIWSYSKINLLKSSIFVPAKKMLSLIFVYSSLLIFTYFAYFILQAFVSANEITLFSIAFGLGGFVSLSLGLLLIYKGLSIKLLGNLEYVYFTLSLIFGAFYYLDLTLSVKFFISLLISFVYFYYFNKVGLVHLLYEKIKHK